MYPHADRAVVALGQAQQLDRAAHPPGRRHVGGADLGDPFAVHVAGPYPGVERQRREDRRLRRRVEALDVGGRVGLGVPERGRLLQRLGEPGPGRVHRRQDEVGGAVDDAGDPDDPVAVQ